MILVPDLPALHQASEALSNLAMAEGSLARSKKNRGELTPAEHHRAKAENLWRVARFLECAAKGEVAL
jgi:hypothetical protein